MLEKINNSKKKINKISLNPYIGTRDFYPEEFKIRNWFFNKIKNICELYGYEEYGTPLLEPLELYLSKTSDEIVNEQIYSFNDRSDRKVAIRPEMTPSLARIVAKKQRELIYPLRLFSLGNFMRYERPGHGRLREFYQLNVDLLGVQNILPQNILPHNILSQNILPHNILSQNILPQNILSQNILPQNILSYVEIAIIAIEILRTFGANENHFKFIFSDRRLLGSYLKTDDLEYLRKLSRIIDKKDKLSSKDFEEQLSQNVKNKNELKDILLLFELNLNDIIILGKQNKIDEVITADLEQFIKLMEERNFLKYIEFNPTLMRGFDYYTDFIFEIYDKNPENKRALFGGGAYNNLLKLYTGNELSAIGFGMGDLTLQNFLEAHNLIDINLNKPQGIFLTTISQEPEIINANFLLAQELRNVKFNVEQMLEPKKISRQFEIAEKKNKRFIIILGSTEIEENTITIKDMITKKQETIERKNIIEYILKNMS